jgi:oligosaccharide translocation protein RFT1
MCRYRVSTSSPGDTAALQHLGEVLGFMVKGVVMLGLAAVSTGPPFAWLAIRIVYGPTWAGTAAPQVLSVYCLYILLLALNGERASKHALCTSRRAIAIAPSR